MLGSRVVEVAATDAAVRIRGALGADVSDEVVLKVVAASVGSFVDAMVQTLAGGEPVVIRRFGRFEAHRRRPRTMRNPQSGEAIVVPERLTVGFAPADVLKATVRGER